MQATNIDEVVAVLDEIIRDYRNRSSRLAYFPALYRAVTVRVRDGIAANQFDDGERMNQLDTAFANRYFAALEADRSGDAAPRAWQVAFEAAQRPGVMILQHLLLGMNAHINYDLPIATADITGAAPLTAVQKDFMTINSILSALLDPVQAALGEFSPMLDVLDRVGGRTDEAIASFSILHARDEAWHEATRLAREAPAHRDRSVLSLDRRVALRAEHLIVPGGVLGHAIGLIAHTESDDVAAVTNRLLEIH